MTRFSRRIFTFLIAIAATAIPAFSLRTTFNGLSDKVCVDLPEGFKLESSNGDNSFQLQSTIAPVHAIIQIIPAGKFKTTEDAMKTTLSRLGVEGDTDTVSWRNNRAAIGIFNGSIMGSSSTGYGCAAIIPENKSILLVLSWSYIQDADRCSSLMTSLVDSIYVDMESYYCQGPLTQYAYPDKEELDTTISIAGKKISTKINKSDVEAADYLIDREYKLLLQYQQSDLWKEAWQRYYRMIFRDSCGRLRQAAFDIYSSLAPECSDNTDYAQKLLSWTQEFKYERQKTTSDFASLPSILTGGGSDCDSRSMLIAVLLQAINEDAIIFVSSEYSHAVAGYASDHPGFGFSVGNKKYLTGETTARGVTWGKINGKQTDESKWIAVSLP